MMKAVDQKPIHIGLNLLYLIPGQVGGTQTYAEELMSALAQLKPSDTFTVYVNQEAQSLPIPPTFRRVICPVYARNRAARYAYEQFKLPQLVKQHRIDVLHSLGYVCPLCLPCPNVVTICDLNYIALVDAMSRIKRAVLGQFVTQSARRSSHIITLSEFSRSQILQHMNVPINKVTSIHLGPKSMPQIDTVSRRESIPGEYGISRPYIVAFSSLLAHKNVKRLLEAFAEGCCDLPHQLTLVGHLPESGDIRALIARLNLSDRVKITGYVPTEHVMPLLTQAELFVFPSLYEGFGLPVLDAQQAHVAVACSTSASLPEVAGDGALFFDPTSIPDMVCVLRECLLDSARRSELVAKGQINLARFSWEKTARETMAVYHTQIVVT